MNDIADHCTVCHKCLAPCPVDIDFGEVSIMMRKILSDHGQKNFSLGTKMSMAFLNAKDPTTIKVLRKGMVQWGFQAQRTASEFVARLPAVAKSKREPASTTGTTRPIEQVVHFVNRKLSFDMSKDPQGFLGAGSGGSRVPSRFTCSKLPVRRTFPARRRKQPLLWCVILAVTFLVVPFVRMVTLQLKDVLQLPTHFIGGVRSLCRQPMGQLPGQKAGYIACCLSPLFIYLHQNLKDWKLIWSSSRRRLRK